jgi:CheY-like chemotaxis protein
VSDDPFSGATKRKVLVCDDERVIADTLVMILRNHGYEAVAAYDGSDAVRQAQSFRPDFVITDVIMPHMNGIEAATAIQKLLPLSKIILFSGQAAATDLVEESQKHGMVFEVLAKPLDPAELLARLDKIDA